jgi:hypothetical protein
VDDVAGDGIVVATEGDTIPGVSGEDFVVSDRRIAVRAIEPFAESVNAGIGIVDDIVLHRDVERSHKQDPDRSGRTGICIGDIGDAAVADAAGRSEPELDSILGDEWGKSDPNHMGAFNRQLGANFGAGDAVLGEVLHDAVGDIYYGLKTAAALNQYAEAALAPGEPRSQNLVDHRQLGQRAGGILKQDTHEIGSATGDAVVGAVNSKIHKIDTLRSLNQDLGCDGC